MFCFLEELTAKMIKLVSCISLLIVGCSSLSVNNETKAHYVDVAIERYQRGSSFEFEYADTDLNGRVDCHSECGGIIKSTCQQGMEQVSCYRPQGKLCCVDSSCRAEGGICHPPPARANEISLGPDLCMAAGSECFAKKCDAGPCHGICANTCPDGTTPLNLPLRKKCRCPDKETCCVDENSCETNTLCDDGKCKEFCAKDEQQCQDRPCFCTNNIKSCCVKKCTEGADGCAAQYPGRGKCREECKKDKGEITMPGNVCKFGCKCCKSPIACEELCGGTCETACPTTTNEDGLPLFSSPAHCFCPAKKTCCVKRGHGGNGVTYGDPHYRTFDGLVFHFHGPCSYVLFQDCVKNPTFSVIAHHVPGIDSKGHHKAFVNALTIHIFHTVIDLNNIDVKVNDTSVLSRMPLKLEPKMEIYVDEKLNRVIVKCQDMFIISWNGNGAIQSTIERNLHGKVCGLLGDADGDDGNDLKMMQPGGTLEYTEDVNKFGYSWEVPASCNSSEMSTNL